MRRSRLFLGSAGCAALIAGLSLLVCGCEGGGGSDGGGGATVADYAGTLTGTWSGSGYSGGFTITINTSGRVSGRYWGDDSGSIAGSVDANGSMVAQASGRAGGATWTGEMRSRDGALSSGSGKWEYPDGSHGSWQGP